MKQLEALAAVLDEVAQVLRGAQRSEVGEPWRLAYDLLFGDDNGLAWRVRAACKAAAVAFPDYYDPDADYQDDVTAYCEAAAGFKTEIDAFITAAAT